MRRRCWLSCALAVAALSVAPGVSAAVPGAARGVSVDTLEAHDTEVGAAPAAQEIDLVLPLRADEAGLERFARAVTTPGSPGFGSYESIMGGNVS